MKNRIAAGALVVAGLATSAGAFDTEAGAFVPAAEAGYMLAAYASDDPIVHNAGAGGGGFLGSLAGGAAGAWAGLKLGGKIGAVIGGPAGGFAGAMLGAA